MESVKDYMDKKAVAQVLEQIAAFLELKSENPSAFGPSAPQPEQ